MSTMTANDPKASQVEELVRYVDDARRARQEQCRSFLSRLAPRLEAARARALELERQTAPRFNVFKYLREDELGLSSVIADLLDPAAEHDQGSSFLKAMLDTLPETSGQFGALQPAASSPIRVVTERVIPSGGRIDITVDIPLDGKSFCLAFENKPYAHDLSGQVRTYLEYLNNEYGQQFLLVYVPPVDRNPDETSISQSDRERWQGHFRVMPYVGRDRSLQAWFAACSKCCEADRVRWFLKSAELFCRERFGGSTMTADAETRFVRDYLSTNPNHHRAALAVHDGWRLFREDVCKRFVEHLRQIVEDRLREEATDIGPDFQVQWDFGGDKKYPNCLWITRKGWIRYDNLPPNKEARSAIRLESGGPGANGWYCGIRSPKPPDKMTKREIERREELRAALGRSGLMLAKENDGPWLQWESLQPHEDWDPLVPDLYKECEERGGPITTHYADTLIAIAAHAIPAINEVEGPESNREH